MALPSSANSSESKHKPFVWLSTDSSVENGVLSVAAAIEVVFAIAIYWIVAILLHTQTHLWFSIAIAPLLLLRSKASVALGVKWFEQYVDYGFEQNPSKAIRTIRSWIAMAAAALIVPMVTIVIARFFLAGHALWTTIALAVFVAYLSAQVGAAVVLGIAANELAALLNWRPVTILFAVSAVLFINLGLYLSSIDLVPAAIAGMATVILAFMGVRGAHTLVQIFPRASAPETRGATAARGLVLNEPLLFAMFAPGAFVGAWLRSVAIRFIATLFHLWSGFIALPDNWWRALFVIDLRYPPEIVPGYRRPDILQPAHLVKELRSATSPLEWFVYLIAFVVMFGPAYVYRLTLKSTCWFYLPIIYIMRPRRFEGSPALLADLLWSSPFEWWRRLLACLVLASFFASQGISAYARAAFPPEVVSPFEYMFLIDIRGIKPWQWFNLASALLTAGIFMWAGTFRIFVRHASRDKSIARLVALRGLFLEYAMRFRNISTALFLVFAFLHVLLWQLPEQLPLYILKSLRNLFG